ncbi:MAG: type II secretion system F family protein [Gemmatimonadota bacterium]|nr:type II secretion system F family protein [Gemmatimonadota bacterium]
MPAFEYRTITADGRRARGRGTAADAPAMVRELESRGLTVLDVAAGEAHASGAAHLPRAVVSDTVRSVAALLAAGLPIARALDIAARTAPPAFGSVLHDVRARIERGEHVAAALAAHPDIFSTAAVGVIRAGERAGDLDGAFNRLAAQLERADALRARLTSALIYPAVLAIAGGAAVLVLLLFVLPRFATLLADTGLPLPRSTAALLTLATFLRAQWIALVLLAAAAVAMALWLHTTPPGRRLRARVLLALPLVGAFRRDLLAASAARTLGVLLRGGAPLSSALDDAADAASDPLLAEALRGVRVRVVAGSTMHGALQADGLFSDIFVALVATGEEAGRLVDFLERAADFFEQRTERGAQRLVALAEPAMIVAFGVVVGGIALSLLQAIYGINPAGLR